MIRNLKLFLRARSDMKAFLALPQPSRKIVFYSEDTHSMIHFEEIIKSLIEDHNERVCYLTSDPRDPVFEKKSERFLPFYIGEGAVRTALFHSLPVGLLILTMPDLGTFHLKRSQTYNVHYLYLFHAMASTHWNYRKGAFDNYDTIFCTGPHQIDEIRETERVYGLESKQIYKDGYRRLESLMDEVAQYLEGRGPEVDTEQKTIVVAPSWGANAILETCGEEVVAHLLDSGYRTVVRPHPMTTKHKPKLLQAIDTKFKANPLFELQVDIRNKSTLYESHAMICDWSGVAMEYAFACERPVIFIDVPRKCNNPEADKISIEPIESSLRGKIGKIVSPERLETLSAEIEAIYSDRESFLNRIRSIRQESVFNLGNSLDGAINEIVRIANQSVSD